MNSKPNKADLALYGVARSKYKNNKHSTPLFKFKKEKNKAVLVVMMLLTPIVFIFSAVNCSVLEFSCQFEFYVQ